MSTLSFAHGSFMAHPRVVAWRNRLRKNEVLRGLYSRWVARHDYEEGFARGLIGAVGVGTVVWDVGANVGLYTRRFLEREAQHVVCFEPAPDAVATLRRQFGAGTSFANRVRVMPIALARESGTLRFAALVAFGVAATSFSIAGITSAFWAIIAGVAAALIVESAELYAHWHGDAPGKVAKSLLHRGSTAS